MSASGPVRTKSIDGGGRLRQHIEAGRKSGAHVDPEVFAKTPGLSASMVVSPFDVGKSTDPWDLLIVDEAHRLSQRASQTSAQKNREFAEINVKLFGTDDKLRTQLDWITETSHHQVSLVDGRQRVRPADLDPTVLTLLGVKAGSQGRRHRLRSQMRVQAGEDHVGYVRAVLSPAPPPARLDFDAYDVQFFDDLATMIEKMRARNDQAGLARVPAGYAWKWQSKNDKLKADIEIGDVALQWNSRVVDWVDSPRSIDEVGRSTRSRARTSTTPE